MWVSPNTQTLLQFSGQQETSCHTIKIVDRIKIWRSVPVPAQLSVSFPDGKAVRGPGTRQMSVLVPSVVGNVHYLGGCRGQSEGIIWSPRSTLFVELTRQFTDSAIIAAIKYTDRGQVVGSRWYALIADFLIDTPREYSFQGATCVCFVCMCTACQWFNSVTVTSEQFFCVCVFVYFGLLPLDTRRLDKLLIVSCHHHS